MKYTWLETECVQLTAERLPPLRNYLKTEVMNIFLKAIIYLILTDAVDPRDY